MKININYDPCKHCKKREKYNSKDDKEFSQICYLCKGAVQESKQYIEDYSYMAKMDYMESVH